MTQFDETVSPEYIRLSMVGRSIFDVYASLHNPQQQAYLSNLSFLKAVAVRRDVDIRKSQIVQAVTAIITLYTLFVTSQATVEFEFLGLKITNLVLFSELLLVIIAVGTFYSITLVLNALLASQMIRAIFLDSGIHHYNYFIADVSTTELWVHSFEPKTIGYSSGLLHKLFVLILALAMVAGSMALPLASTVVVNYFGSRSIAANGIFSTPGIVAAFSMLAATCSVVYFVVALAVPLKFRMTRAMRSRSNAETS